MQKACESVFSRSPSLTLRFCVNMDRNSLKHQPEASARATIHPKRGQPATIDWSRGLFASQFHALGHSLQLARRGEHHRYLVLAILTFQGVERT
jgi:hypothetical protein